MTRAASTEEFLAAIWAKCGEAGSGSIDTQYHAVLDLVRMLGCQYVVYERRRPVPLAEARYDTFHNLPPRIAGLRKPPSVQGKTPRLEFWTSDATAPDESFWGWTVNMGPGLGWNASLVGISDQPQFVDQTRSALILCTAHLAHWLLSSALEQSAIGHQKLSPREVEVLRWTADGKTSGDIAALLVVSENTINFHLKNIKEKLACSTKTSSAVYAAMLGLLTQVRGRLNHRVRESEAGVRALGAARHPVVGARSTEK